MATQDCFFRVIRKYSKVKSAKAISCRTRVMQKGMQGLLMISSGSGCSLASTVSWIPQLTVFTLKITGSVPSDTAIDRFHTNGWFSPNLITCRASKPDDYSHSRSKKMWAEALPMETCTPKPKFRAFNHPQHKPGKLHFYTDYRKYI